MNATSTRARRGPDPAPADAQAVGRVPQPLLDVLCSFAAGTPGRTTHQVLGNPAVAAVFSADAEFRAIALGDGLWAAVRSGADGSCRVIAVHNVSSLSRQFSLPGELSGSGSSLRFLCGEVRTSEAADETVCELKPWGFVWLAVCEKDTPQAPSPSPLC